MSEPFDGQPIVDERRYVRERLNVPGLVGIPGLRLMVPCRVNDISVAGAGVVLLPSVTRIRHASDLPDVVKLIFCDRAEVEANIRWRYRASFGLLFRGVFHRTDRPQWPVH